MKRPAVDVYDRPLKPVDEGTAGLPMFGGESSVPAWAQSWGSLSVDHLREVRCVCQKRRAA